MEMVVKISSDAAAVIAQVGAFPKRMGQAIGMALDRQNSYTVGAIQRDRLTGHPAQPYPASEGRLRLITGTYRARTAWLPSTVSGNRVESAIVVGVSYAAPQEFGFRATVQVPAHQRKTKGGTVNVRAYPMRMNLPARAPVSRGLEARLPAYGEALSAAVIASWRGGRA